MVYIESITLTKVSILCSIKVTKFEVAFKCEPSNQWVTTLMIEKWNMLTTSEKVYVEWVDLTIK